MSDDNKKEEKSSGEAEYIEALKVVLKNALKHDGLSRGLHECAKTLDRRQGHLCVLATNCSEAQYIKLVQALCFEHGTNLIKVPDNKKLGEWAGLAKYDREGKPRKVIGCSVVVVKDFGERSPELQTLLDHLEKKN
eukprot:TRINITY_DN64150_c0_g1_i1.p2 TRINITY_DN64150_c0_g1~~TRINITY_DN64150_c0_g1_i1.p2  ORF type:complete len:136 (-),score=33.76 TRINITY_DN64150_c0_g1_i1:45-452(-)